jgi:hypothetical protein
MIRFAPSEPSEFDDLAAAGDYEARIAEEEGEA